MGLETIDMVVVNLYPFVQTVANPDATLEDALENIDIGGPTLLRAAGKNFPSVTVVVDPADYGWVAQRLAASGTTVEERRSLAHKAFDHVSRYDAAVVRYLAGPGEGGGNGDAHQGAVVFNNWQGENRSASLPRDLVLCVVLELLKVGDGCADLCLVDVDAAIYQRSSVCGKLALMGWPC